MRTVRYMFPSSGGTTSTSSTGSGPSTRSLGSRYKGKASRPELAFCLSVAWDRQSLESIKERIKVDRRWGEVGKLNRRWGLEDFDGTLVKERRWKCRADCGEEMEVPIVKRRWKCKFAELRGRRLEKYGSTENTE
ncbi:hypothetical protein Droror1_Dr00015136 [Drosera rotundifolia]